MVMEYSVPIHTASLVAWLCWDLSQLSSPAGFRVLLQVRLPEGWLTQLRGSAEFKLSLGPQGNETLYSKAEFGSRWEEGCLTEASCTCAVASSGCLFQEGHMPAGLEKGTALSCTELRIEPLYFQRPFHPEILTYFYNFSSRARERGKLYTLFTPRKIIIRASKGQFIR